MFSLSSIGEVGGVSSISSSSSSDLVSDSASDSAAKKYMPQAYKTFLMLNSSEHDIYPAHELMLK